MTRRSRHSSAIPAMLHQSRTPPWLQSETCLRPAANDCTIWYQQAPTQDQQTWIVTNHQGAFDSFWKAAEVFQEFWLRDPIDPAFENNPRRLYCLGNGFQRLLRADRRRAEDQVKCDLRSSEMGCHGLSGLAATLVKRPIEIIEARILPARLRVTQQVEGLHSLAPQKPLRRLPPIYTLSNSI